MALTADTGTFNDGKVRCLCSDGAGAPAPALVAPALPVAPAAACSLPPHPCPCCRRPAAVAVQLHLWRLLPRPSLHVGAAPPVQGQPQALSTKLVLSGWPPA